MVSASRETLETDSAAPAAADAASLWMVALRDIAIVAAALSLFAAADTWYTLTGTTLAAALSLVDGLLVGLAVTSLLHEWGHFTGARLMGSRAPLVPAAQFPRLFDFDYQRNDTAAFQAMSIGGNVAHWLVFVALLASLPLATVGQIAIVSASFGACVFASSIELPVIRLAYQGASGPEAIASIRKDFLRHHGRYGLAAAFVAFLVL